MGNTEEGAAGAEETVDDDGDMLEGAEETKISAEDTMEDGELVKDMAEEGRGRRRGRREREQGGG